MKIDVASGVISLRDSDEEALSILIAGDFCPREQGERLILGGGSRHFLRHMQTELEGNDFSLVNLETPLTTSEIPILKSGPNLKADLRCVEFLRAGKWDAVCGANNHIGDFGDEGVLETLDVLRKNNIRYVGAGVNAEEAAEPLIYEKGGVRVAILAITENEFGIAETNRPGANSLRPTTNIRQIRKAARENDSCIVLMHGGNEYNPNPSPRVVDTYRAFIEAGASAVIGGHPHCPQGIEIWEGAPIAYSISNFFFPAVDPALVTFSGYNWWYGYMVRLRIAKSGVLSLQLLPHVYKQEEESLRFLDGDERVEFLRYLNALNEIIVSPGEIERYFDAWCMIYGEHMLSAAGMSFYPLDWNDPKAVALLMRRRNMMTCEAHNELLTRRCRIAADRREVEAIEYKDKLETLCAGKIP